MMVANRSMSVGAEVSGMAVQPSPNLRRPSTNVWSRPASDGGGFVEHRLDKDEVARRMKRRKSTVLLLSASSSVATTSLDDTHRTLHQMAGEGDVAGVRRLLDEDIRKMRVDEFDANRRTPLHHAARYDQYDVVRLLIDAGADVKLKTGDGLTPLHLAARYKHRPRHRDIEMDTHGHTQPQPHPHDLDEQSEVTDTDTANAAAAAAGSKSNGHGYPVGSTAGTDGASSVIDWSPMRVKGSGNGSSVDIRKTTVKPFRLWNERRKSRVLLMANFMRRLSKSSESASSSNSGIEATFFRGVTGPGRPSTSMQSPSSVITYLLARGAEVNSKDFHGLTALHHAIMCRNVPAVLELVRCKGVNIEAHDMEDRTPLHLAANQGNQNDALTVARLLLQAGANRRSRDESHATPLLRAAAVGNLDMIRLLLESAEVHVGSTAAVSQMLMDQDGEGNTALHLATEIGHTDIVRYLVSRGANVNLPRQKQEYPLHLAAAAGDVDCVHILLETDASVNCPNENLETPLHRACEFDHVAIVEALLENGADPERRDRRKLSPLLVAAQNGHVETIRCLLRHGVDPNTRDDYEQTAVHLAAKHDHHEALLALLDDPSTPKALLRQTDRFGNTALHVAASLGFFRIARSLVQRGCPIDLKNDEQEQTALHLAAHHGRTKIVREFVGHGTQLVNAEDENGHTALHLAALAGHEQVIQILLEMGANVDARSGQMWTPLDCASSRGHIKSVRMLLDAGSAINNRDNFKTSSLHLAAATGSPETVLTLLQCGADVNLRDENGRNCLEIAIDNSRKDVASAIVQSCYWEKAVRSERYTDNGLRETPLRMLIRKMPDVAEEVLARCTETNDLPVDHPHYTVKFQYELLDDSYVTFDGAGTVASAATSLSSHEDNLSSRRSSTAQSTASLKESKTVVNRNEYSKYGIVLKENHPLIIMVRSGRSKLLAHPLCLSLLHLKWTSFGRYVYYTNLSLYLVFVAFLSIYVLTMPKPIRTDDPNFSITVNRSDDTTETVLVSVCEMSPATQRRLNLRPTPLLTTVQWIIVAFCIVHLVKELLQFYMIQLKYFGCENLMEWACYVTSLVLTIDFTECTRTTGVREVWQWQVGAIAIFLCWVNLVLFISKFPYFGLYVFMFIDVCRTFCKVGIVFFFMFVAYAFCYHTLMYYKEPFDYASKAIVRVIVMMLMEFQFDDIFHDNELLYPIPSYVLFALTTTVVSLIIMNLLIGLSVCQIKSFQAQANLKRLAMQVELVLNVEAVLPSILRKRVAIQERSFVPNSRKRSLPYRLFSDTRALREALASPQKLLNLSETMVVYHCREREIEQMQKEQNHLMMHAAQMTESIEGLQNESRALQATLTTILRHQGVRYEDFEDYDDNDIGVMNDDDGGGSGDNNLRASERKGIQRK